MERIADHVFVIHKGRLALERSLEELRENCRRMHFAFPGRAPVEQMTLPGVRKVLRRVIALSSDAQGEQTVSPMPLINYSRALYDLERLDEAADYCERGYAKARQAGDDLGSSQALLMRAAILRSKGDPRGSEQTLLEAEPLLRRHLPPGHIAFASLASLRALNARALGDAHAALGLFE